MLQLVVYETEMGPTVRTPTKRIDGDILFMGSSHDVSGVQLVDGTPAYILKFDRESGLKLKAAIEQGLREMDSYYTEAKYYCIQDRWVMFLPDGGNRDATQQEIEEARAHAA